MIWPDPNHQPTHPPTHQIIHPPMGGGVSKDFKSSNRIEISQLVQVLLNFEWFWGSPWGVGWIYGGRGWWEGASHPHAHAHTCMHVHTHTQVYDIIGNSQGFPHGGSHLHEIIMFTMHACVCMCMHAHACAHMWGHPPTTPTPIHPPPRATGSRKHQNSITLELIEIIWFCLKTFYLWTFLNSYRL